ncbi:MAG: hypothetical protein E7256_05690 [Lachnospiraceae bacterium]|nr:hypothetical protein [Lachnospiraceae bacterium]
MNYINSILLGFGSFPLFAILFTLPIFLFTIIRYKAINFVRIGLNYAMLLYLLCVTALVFFPLPTVEEAANLHGHHAQLIPFHFIVDIAKESPLVLTEPATYLRAAFDHTVLQVVFNVIMTIPFGMYLRYYCGCQAKKVVVLSFLLSLFIEVTQLTGIYGVYQGSYRFCDVDDLMTNTLGGYLGYSLIVHIESRIPSIHVFDRKIAKAGNHRKISGAHASM